MTGIRKKKQNHSWKIRRTGIACLLSVCLAVGSGAAMGCAPGAGQAAERTTPDEAETGNEQTTQLPDEDETTKGRPEDGPTESQKTDGQAAEDQTQESQTASAASVREWLMVGSEPREAWIVAFETLNVRRFCYPRATIVGTFGEGQKITVTGPARYGFYPVTGTDAQSGEELRGWCSADYVSFMEYTGNAVHLEIERYGQTDERWGHLNLGDSRVNIAQAGCTTTCFAMCESYLSGTEVTPDMMWENLVYSNEGNLYWPDNYYQDYSSDFLVRIYQKLHQGIPVLIGARQSNGSQHWVLVTGYDPGDKEITSSSQLKYADFIINDPAPKNRKTLAEFFRDLPNFIKFAYYLGEAGR
ncbi:MAG: hypothetical protein HFI38_12335 [Lachnospiraceae bacterium]|jgi:hypothetical protein|nr:hypothetical protein [Lachnospiraceae bacterium]